MKSIRQIYKRLKALAEVAHVTGSSPYNGTALDLANVLEAKIDFVIEAWTDGTHTPKLQESSDNSNWSDVAAADQDGSLTAISSNASVGTTQSVGYLGSKRYIRAVWSASGTTSGAIVGASYQVRYRKQPFS